MNEFEIIDQCFTRKGSANSSTVKVGIGDDGAVLSCDEDKDLVVVTDTLVSGVHFCAASRPADIGYKSLAVNLSDLAAMGADPNWALLNLAMPDAEPKWLEEFADGFFELADRFDVQLVGGDTSVGPLTVTVTAGGWIPNEEAITREGAKPGDLVFVSGTLGDAALGLELGLDDKQIIKWPNLTRIHRPEPRIKLGRELRNFASAAIDLSDGLASDLMHLTSASGGMGAVIYQERIPFSNDACSLRSLDELLSLALSGGDDYELCFTVDPSREKDIALLSDRAGVRITCIGAVSETPGFWLIDLAGKCEQYSEGGYQHQWSVDTQY